MQRQLKYDLLNVQADVDQQALSSSSCVCSLQEEYPKWFEKPVLEMVHHNTLSLDKLVEMAWLEILTKYAVGEECNFLVSASSPVVAA